MRKLMLLSCVAALTGCAAVEFEAASKSSLSSMRVTHQDPDGRTYSTTVECDDGNSSVMTGLVFDKSVRSNRCGGLYAAGAYGYGYGGYGRWYGPHGAAVGMVPDSVPHVETVPVTVSGAVGARGMVDETAAAPAVAPSSLDPRVGEIENRVTTAEGNIKNLAENQRGFRDVLAIQACEKREDREACLKQAKGGK